MERLTKRGPLAGHNVAYVSCEDCFDVWSVPKKFMGNAIDRLAAIEDILGDTYDIDHLRGLVEADKSGRCTIISTPERIMFYENLEHDIEPDRLRELVEADKDGRCVVLPSREAAEAALAKEAK